MCTRIFQEILLHSLLHGDYGVTVNTGVCGALDPGSIPGSRPKIMKALILASSSPWRKRALQKAGLSFEVVPSDFEEDMTLPFLPEKLAIHLSQGKARAVAKNIEKGSVVLGADTLVSFAGQLYGKPHTVERAREMLRELSGNTHSTITGFTIIDTASGKEYTQSVETRVTFKPLSEEDINAYLALDEPLHCAASYAIEKNGKQIIARIQGSESNVSGLPIEEVSVALKACGVCN